MIYNTALICTETVLTEIHTKLKFSISCRILYFDQNCVFWLLERHAIFIISDFMLMDWKWTEYKISNNVIFMQYNILQLLMLMMGKNVQI
jgi:hypothetical protein